MEILDTTGKIIFGCMLFASILLLVAIYLLIQRYKRDKEKEKRIKEETAINKLRILTFQQGMKTILEFFPHPDEKNPFENNYQEKN